MKTYVCDSCGDVIHDPYQAKMKEFYYTPDYSHGYFVPSEMRSKRKIHLCGRCFKALKYLFEEGSEKQCSAEDGLASTHSK